MGGMPDANWQAMIDSIFTTRTPMDRNDAEASMAAFERHNEEVRRHVPAERLVVWEAKDGWAPLCKALNVPIPDEQFPITNTRADFLAMLAASKERAPAQAT